jgi:DNA-binding NarL/FixJ family response regulator
MSLPHPPTRSDELWQPARLRALIADDSDLYSEAIALTLELEPGIELVGRACDGSEAVELTLSLRPDVVLMDLDMPGLDGIEATKAVLAAMPSVRVVMVTASADDLDRRRAEEAGVSAYVRKGGFAGELFQAIFGTSSGSRRRAARAEPPRGRPPRQRGPETTYGLPASP